MPMKMNTTNGSITISGEDGVGNANVTVLRAGIAGSGPNADITSLTGLTTALSLAQGGTGATTAQGALDNLGAVDIGLVIALGG
jgi:hypothetical protein